MPTSRPFRVASLACLLLASAFGLSAPVEPAPNACLDDDRDGDGIVDVLDNCPEIANAEQGDCDADGTGDACESVTITSGDLGGFSGGPASGTLRDVGPTLWPVTVSVRAIGDLAARGTSVSLSFAGVEAATGLFASGGSSCPATPDEATVTLTAEQWNALVALVPDRTMPVSVAGNPQAEPAACATAFTEVTVTLALAADCDGNGTIDACDLAAGTLVDCDGDGVPDLCAIEDGTAIDADGDGEPDTCERARGDLDLDGTVGGSDLSLLLSMWGQLNPAFGDFDGDGLIGAGDLAFLLSKWSGPPPQIDGVTPAEGPAEGGTEITITGTNLDGTTAVRVGGSRATGLVQLSPTAVRATVPAGEPGPVAVSVTTPSGTASAPNGFTYIANLVAPTVTSVTPSQGPIAGGTAITIVGTNFTGATVVKVGTVNATGVTVVNATTITATTPASSTGTWSVSVTTPSGTGTKNGAFTYFAPPSITTVLPTSGPIAGGTTMTITGTKFFGTTSVTVGGVAAASFVVVSATKVTAVTPAGTAGAKDVVLTTPGGTVTRANGFTYFPPPTITSVTPNQGGTAGGTAITITGTNLTGATAVKIGTASATGVTVVNPTTITATTPSATGGAKSVSVTTPGGTATLTNGFVYFATPAISTINPKAGPTTGGTTITINGSGLGGVTSVTIDGVAATSFTVVSATKITALTPAGTTGPKNVTVSTPIGSATKTGGFTYYVPPTLSSVAPGSGPTTGGTVLTITGTNLFGTTSVKLGTASALFAVVNATTITAVAPAATAGPRTVSVTTPGGTATIANGFSYFVPPAITTITPPSGPIAGGTTIAINGSGFGGATSVTIDGVAAASFTVASATRINAVTPAGVAGPAAVTVTTPGGTATRTGGFTYWSGDECASAVTAVIGANPFSTVYATNSPDAVNESQCAGSSLDWGSANKDVWFRYVPPANGLLTVDTCDLAGFDTSMVLYEGASCGTKTQIACNGDGTGLQACQSFYSRIESVLVTAGTSYWVRIGGWDGGSGPAAGSGNLNLAFEVPPPVIETIEPDTGRDGGGTPITITGAFLAGTTDVTIGGLPATSVVAVNSTTITAVTPAGTAGPASVTVTTPEGMATVADGYTYVTPVVPDWANVIAANPDPAVVTDAAMRTAIMATVYPWKVEDKETGIEMLLVPPGTFNMGCSPLILQQAQSCYERENPVHAVTLTNAFYLGRYEVTQAQWTAVMGSNPSTFQTASAQVPAEQVPLCPVEEVSWDMIQVFNARTGLRLPTEAEWEYAYRAGTTTAFHSFSGYPNGTNDDALLGDIAHFQGNTLPPYSPRPVGGKHANALGLHDMSGNVYEWVNDRAGFDYYESSPSTNPPGPTTGEYRVLRGGSYFSFSFSCRSSDREVDLPDGSGAIGYDLGLWGFRAARTPFPTLSITDVSPNVGSQAGGTMITITGAGFTEASEVFVAGVAATEVTVVNATTITAVTPAGTVGPASVAVMAVMAPYDGPAVASNAFTYLLSWATVLEQVPDPAVVTNEAYREAIVATGLPWRVEDSETGIEMLLVPPGTFNMGCSASDEYGCDGTETPVHAVTLTNAFYLGRYEVTQAQWEAVMGSTPSYFSNPSDEVLAAQVPLRPVEMVSWNMIQEFNTATGLRLPTEAEWEYAYRAGTTTAFHSFSGYPNGTNDDTLLGNIAWWVMESASQTRPVGGKQANALGLHDMSGNVFEWVNDRAGVDYYDSSPWTNPPGPTTGEYRVSRGGSWKDISRYCRSSVRVTSTPDFVYFTNGFRAARTPFSTLSITDVSPNVGSQDGGTMITITGAGFTEASEVLVAGVAATEVTVVNATTITAVTPAGTAGPASVAVIAPYHGTAVASNAFTYLYLPSWATVLEAAPDPAVVTDAALRDAIVATGLPWRVEDSETGIEMLLVPPGTFNMGCSASNQYACSSDGRENPVHAVTLTNAFYLGRYEVTQAQWEAVMGSTPSYFSNPSDEVLAAQVPLRPVEQVSWNMIQGFNTATGLRLPTEAEWEYAYRAGTTTAFHSFTGYPNGTNDDTLLESIAWFTSNSADQTRPVGGKQANALGLHDMSGNVYEWVNDRAGVDYYESSPSTNPPGPATGSSRVLRGGSWAHGSVSCRSSDRGLNSPDLVNPDIGFRAARTP